MNILEDIYKFREQYQDGIVIIYWPTATGKTKMSVQVASNIPNTQIISADSRQIYKYMDIWTDKIDINIRNQIPHHLIDIIDPDENYTAVDWQKDTYNILEWGNGLNLIVWWTWLYIDTIYRNYNLWTVDADMIRRTELEDLESKNIGYCWNLLNSVDPVEAQKHHPSSIRFVIRAIEIYEKTWIPKSIYMSQNPVKYPILMISLLRETNRWNELINTRIDEMLNKWLVDEVSELMSKYPSDLKSMQSIDYKQVVWYIKWEYNYDKMIELLRIANHQLAKKQRTWFRKYNTESQNNPKDRVIYREYMID